MAKSQLNLYCQAKHIAHPTYSTCPAMSGGFCSTVCVCGKEYSSQTLHPSKKAAQEDAACVALEDIRAGDATSAQSLLLSKRAPGFVCANNTQGIPTGTLAESLPSEPPSGSPAGDYLIASNNLANRPSPPIIHHRSAVVTSPATSTPAAIDNNCIEATEPSSLTAHQWTPTTTSPATSPASTSISSLENTIMSYTHQSYEQKLESLCLARGLPTPEYGKKRTGSRVTVTVSIEGRGSYLEESDTYSKAREHVALVALAELALQFLNISGDQKDHADKNGILPRSVNNKTAAPSPQALLTALPSANYKALLNEYCQKNYFPLPQYETEYPEDSTGYIARVNVCGKEYVSTVQMAKKMAEQKAASQAALDLGLVKVDEEEAKEKSMQSPREIAAENTVHNYKAILQEYLQRQDRRLPQYSTDGNSLGLFVSTVTVYDLLGKSSFFQGKGFSNKKSAEQDAARQACANFKL